MMSGSPPRRWNTARSFSLPIVISSGSPAWRIRYFDENSARTHILKDVKDITRILYQIAITTGVLIVAF